MRAIGVGGMFDWGASLVRSAESRALDAAARLSRFEHSDPAKELAHLTISRAELRMGALLIRTADEMLGEILDLRA